MKAIRVHEGGGPEVLKLEEVPTPKPGSGEILVKIRAIGINPVDTYIRTGGYMPINYPYTPGFDAAGEIESVGSGVGAFKSGDRVYLSGSLTGAYAEYALCNTSQVHPLADKISFAQGAGVNVPYATAYRAFWIRAHAIPGQSVLVHGGSGGVGIAAIQMARAAGFTVIATAGTDDGLELIKREGAHLAVSHKDPTYGEKIMDFTGERGVDIIMEMLANVNLDKDLDLIAKGGRIVIIGNRGSIEINPRKTMAKDANILGMTLLNATPNELVIIHSSIVAGLESGALRPVVRKEFPLAEASKAHELVMEPGAGGKIVLIP